MNERQAVSPWKARPDNGLPFWAITGLAQTLGLEPKYYRVCNFQGQQVCYDSRLKDKYKKNRTSISTSLDKIKSNLSYYKAAESDATITRELKEIHQNALCPKCLPGRQSSSTMCQDILMWKKKLLSEYGQQKRYGQHRWEGAYSTERLTILLGDPEAIFSILAIPFAQMASNSNAVTCGGQYFLRDVPPCNWLCNAQFLHISMNSLDPSSYDSIHLLYCSLMCNRCFVATSEDDQIVGDWYDRLFAYLTNTRDKQWQFPVDSQKGQQGQQPSWTSREQDQRYSSRNNQIAASQIASQVQPANKLQSNNQSVARSLTDDEMLEELRDRIGQAAHSELFGKLAQLVHDRAFSIANVAVSISTQDVTTSSDGESLSAGIRHYGGAGAFDTEV